MPRFLRARSTDLCLLAVAITWGSSYLAAKVATGLVAADAVVFLRYAVSAVACLAIVGVLAARGRANRPTLREVRLGGVLGITQAAVLYLETHGVAHTSAAAAGVLMSLTIILTPLAGVVIGTRVPGRFYAAAGVCIVGVGVMLDTQSGPGGWDGSLLVLAAAVIRAGHVTLLGRLTRADETGRGRVRPLQLTTVQLVVGTALTAPPALPQLAANPGVLVTPELVVAILYLALFCSVFAFLAQTWAVRRTSANRASLLLGTEPLWAVAAAIALEGERLSVTMALGAALIIAGCWWGQLVEQRSRTPAGSRRHGRLRRVVDRHPVADVVVVADAVVEGGAVDHRLG
ncbi:DMT family transporter [Rathayibacter sp. CAU 1779]